MSGFFGRLGLGFLISIPITSIVAGGVEDAFGLFVISIVCTGGIGLVFWIPVWWLVGALAFLLIGIVWKTEEKSDPKPKPIRNPTKLPSADYLALKAYIAKVMASGMGVEEMTRRLQNNGWKAADIESAYQSFISSKSSIHST